MKKLVLIIGPNGVGKTTTAQALLKRCPHCAYVDSDCCRAIHPFSLTEATKKTVTDNIFSLLKNYLLCREIETVLFTYGFHGERKEIFDEVLRRLKEEGIVFTLCPVVLKCSLEENRKRMAHDGRDKVRIERGIVNTFHFYDNYACPVIDSTELSPEQTADEIMKGLTEYADPATEDMDVF